MLFTNACIFLPEGRFQRGCFRVENGRFTQVGEEASGEGIDLQGALVLPGLVDIHTHGCAGADFSDGDLTGLKRIGRFYAAHGDTAFCPTSMSLPYERLREAFLTAAAYADNPPEGGARMAGSHMEGPFLSPAKRGAQNEAYLRLPDDRTRACLYTDVCPTEEPEDDDYYYYVKAVPKMTVSASSKKVQRINPQKR